MRRRVIECLPTCQGPGNPAKYEPVEAGPYVQALIEQSNRIGRPGVMQTNGRGAADTCLIGFFRVAVSRWTLRSALP